MITRNLYKNINDKILLERKIINLSKEINESINKIYKKHSMIKIVGL